MCRPVPSTPRATRARLTYPVQGKVAGANRARLLAPVPPFLGQYTPNLEWGCVSTEKKIVGLASVDRNNKATLLLTAPRCITKSYAKVLSPRMVKLQDVS